jgi:hypothetical protein
MKMNHYDNLKRPLKYIAGLAFLSSLTLLTACAPEVGSIEWCEAMEERPKGDWTANEVTDYAKHCIIPKSEE